MKRLINLILMEIGLKKKKQCGKTLIDEYKLQWACVKTEGHFGKHKTIRGREFG